MDTIVNGATDTASTDIDSTASSGGNGFRSMPSVDREAGLTDAVVAGGSALSATNPSISTTLPATSHYVYEECNQNPLAGGWQDYVNIVNPLYENRDPHMYGHQKKGQ